MKVDYIAGFILLVVLLSIWSLSMTAYTACFFMFWLKSKMKSIVDSIDRAFVNVKFL